MNSRPDPTPADTVSMNFCQIYNAGARAAERQWSLDLSSRVEVNSQGRYKLFDSTKRSGAGIMFPNGAFVEYWDLRAARAAWDKLWAA